MLGNELQVKVLVKCYLLSLSKILGNLVLLVENRKYNSIGLDQKSFFNEHFLQCTVY